MVVGVGQQRQVACMLDRPGELALITRFGTGDPAGYDFARFADELFQQIEILVIDLGDSFSGEATEFSAFELACRV